MSDSKFKGYSSQNSKPIKRKKDVKEPEIKGVSFLELKISYVYKIINTKTQTTYKLLIINPLKRYYEENRVNVEVFNRYEEGHFSIDYYCYDIEREQFMYFTETCESFFDVYIEEDKKEMRKKDFTALLQKANYFYKQHEEMNKELDALRKKYLRKYEEIVVNYEDRTLFSNLIMGAEDLALKLLNSSEDAMSIEEFEKYLYSCLSPEVKMVLSSPHKYDFCFYEDREGDDEEKKIYRLMIERDIKVKKDKNSLKCIKKENRRNGVSYLLDKEHPEYQSLLMKERDTEGSYIYNIKFKDLPFSIGGSYASGRFMDSLYLVDYRNVRYKNRKNRPSEGVYYHRYLLMYDYKVFKLTKENAEIIAKSIYLEK